METKTKIIEQLAQVLNLFFLEDTLRFIYPIKTASRRQNIIKTERITIRSINNNEKTGRNYRRHTRLPLYVIARANCCEPCAASRTRVPFVTRPRYERRRRRRRPAPSRGTTTIRGVLLF